ncbi:MAG: glucosylglycerol hydrolase [Cyanobacteria bacterium P01_G01_bin.38]
MSKITLVEDATQAFLNWISAFTYADEEVFHRARILATRLGAYYRPDGLTEVAFWVPDVGQGGLHYWGWSKIDHHNQIKNSKNIYLEILTPLEPIDFRASQQVILFRRDRLPLKRQQEYFCGVFSGMRPGTREQAGCFYWLRYVDDQNQLQTIGDVMAYSLPYGVFAPAELYDIDRLQRHRADLSYFRQNFSQNEPQSTIKVTPPHNILQLHVSTASTAGSLAGLTCLYQGIANKLKAETALTPAEENYIGYDAIQLLPIEPIVEYQAAGSTRPGFFNWNEVDQPDDPHQPTDPAPSAPLSVTLTQPDTRNWGYDIVLAASSATNPALLESLRPDELVDFIATLHTFPTGPIQVIYDLVYGHTDNQAKALLNRHFLNGSNMYGQNVNHRNPITRAILLEMQRRKINTGADGIRVDGAQDFKFFNPQSGQVEYDDDYLKEMSAVLQEIGGQQRQLFSIFEDGRPWPRADWEESSTYLDVIKQQPEAYQWGPLIFAHNTPTLNQFWNNKWRRVCEVMQQGSHWITGCGNHDTVRRGTQVDPQADINWNLGKTLPAVIRHAYDNPAVALLFYGFSPGLPMDFLNATMRAPWCFFRNTDDIYGLKVVAEEVRFLDWQIEPARYDDADTFVRLKQLDITRFKELRVFMAWLNETVTHLGDDYDLEVLAQLCQDFLATRLPEPAQITAQTLRVFARAYMEDCHDLCRVDRYAAALDPQQTRFNLTLRRYRHAHPWLGENLTPQDRFERISDNTQTIFYGLRSEPTQSENQRPGQVVVVTHMGGEPVTVRLADWLGLEMSQWRVALASPGLELETLNSFRLRDSQGLLLEPV